MKWVKITERVPNIQDAVIARDINTKIQCMDLQDFINKNPDWFDNLEWLDESPTQSQRVWDEEMNKWVERPNKTIEEQTQEQKEWDESNRKFKEWAGNIEQGEWSERKAIEFLVWVLKAYQFDDSCIITPFEHLTQEFLKQTKYPAQEKIRPTPQTESEGGGECLTDAEKKTWWGSLVQQRDEAIKQLQALQSSNDKLVEALNEMLESYNSEWSIPSFTLDKAKSLLSKLSSIPDK